ncbi:MAG: Glyoxylate/hydroxypyruvate reductase A [Hyphomicrobiaceae bacterium hypho_1]
MALLIIGKDIIKDYYHEICKQAPHRDIRLWPNIGDPNDILHALAWHPEHGELARLPNLKTIVSLGAGVDHLLEDLKLPNVPVIRYVDPDLTSRMVEYIILNTLLHTRRMMEYQNQQRVSKWQYLPVPTAKDIRVGIMGMGVLGSAAASALYGMGFKIRGWSRRIQQIENILSFAGTENLDTFLAETDILVVLLPDTKKTKGLINRMLIRKLSLSGRHPSLPGPVLINGGRGAVQIETDILAALETGELYSASLDVFENEPLSLDSPLWKHPRVSITPHTAGVSTPEVIAAYFLNHVKSSESGKCPKNVVDRSVGY